ncbi:hypothetical protein HG263_04635 [Pseudoalteromonas sp. JBTF-M23]|uniref:Uncharacterized protein n=1 Tax=Pseudoalteromonas caenipelagi TaxID=2726988 RepID=A0A849VAM3_9GAMM|nr:hypothetical protein [Pseudoalteromonas caenipelagi]NOU49820.1 hypothetical protein [Pseudoalteromonas caenipelagi]
MQLLHQVKCVQIKRQGSGFAFCYDFAELEKNKLNGFPRKSLNFPECLLPFFKRQKSRPDSIYKSALLLTISLGIGLEDPVQNGLLLTAHRQLTT